MQGAPLAPNGRGTPGGASRVDGGQTEMAMTHRWIVVANLLALAGCAGQTTLYNAYVATPYTPTEFGVGAGRKDLRVEVRGDPFAMGQQAFAEATVEILQRFQPRPQPTRFTLEPGENSNPAYRMQLLFDAPRAVNPISGCRNPPVAETDAATVRVSAMFCRNQGTLTQVSGEVGGVTSVDDPGFAQLMQQIVIALFPTRDPQRDREQPILIP